MIRIPTTYSLHRSETGRITSGVDTSDLEKTAGRRKVQQVHNIPKKLRDAFVGHLVGGDWAGIEWAITMHFCAQLNTPPGFHEDLLQRFRAGEFDPHRHLASVAYGVPPSKVTSDQRASVKPFTHGRTYLGSPATLGRGAVVSDDRLLAVARERRVVEDDRCLVHDSQPRDLRQHVRRYHRGLLQAIYRRVCEAHERAFQVRPWQRQTIEQCKRRKFVETPLGWRRYFWEPEPKENEVLATLVQATAADLLKWTLARARPEPGAYRFVFLTQTHDSFLLEAANPEAQGLATRWLRDLMQAPVPWLEGRSFRADVRAGRTWKEVSS